MRRGSLAYPARALSIVSLVTFAVFGASASTAGTWPTDGVGICVGPGNQGRTGIVSDGSGGIIVTWQFAQGASQDIYALRIDSSGQPAPGWPACGVRACTAAGIEEYGTAVTDGAGGAIVL